MQQIFLRFSVNFKDRGEIALADILVTPLLYIMEADEISSATTILETQRGSNLALCPRLKPDTKVRAAERYVSSQRYVYKGTSCPYDRLPLSCWVACPGLGNVPASRL